MGEMSMVGMVLRKAATVLLTILKWILMAVLMLLKLVLGIAKLFLLLLALVARATNHLQSPDILHFLCFQKM